MPACNYTSYNTDMLALGSFGALNCDFKWHDLCTLYSDFLNENKVFLRAMALKKHFWIPKEPFSG